MDELTKQLMEIARTWRIEIINTYYNEFELMWLDLPDGVAIVHFGVITYVPGLKRIRAEAFVRSLYAWYLGGDSKYLKGLE